jgi:hypothetical protein
LRQKGEMTKWDKGEERTYWDTKAMVVTTIGRDIFPNQWN